MNWLGNYLLINKLYIGPEIVETQLSAEKNVGKINLHDRFYGQCRNQNSVITGNFPL